MNKYYFSIVEIISFLIYVPLVYGYVWYIYDDQTIVKVGIVAFIVAPILSSVTASYRYELKYHYFIESQVLIKSSFLLYAPHLILSSVVVYAFDDFSGWAVFLRNSALVAGIQMLFIILSVTLFGKYVNSCLLKK